MGKHGLTLYPFSESLNYSDIETEVFYVEEKQLYYINHNNKKLYFPGNNTVKEIKDLYKNLIIEQDINSPHRYIEDYSVLKDYILFDIGAAEGIFTLDTIELIKEAYLFECEDYWIEALNETFSPWKDKVHIIKKYVSDIDGDNFITLDSFYDIKEKNDKIFLKMDIEGAEQSALKGSQNILKYSSNIILSVCTYHNSKDDVEIDSFFKALEFKTRFTDGFLYWGSKSMSLRKAILKATK
jgi:hypothetical protein